MRMIDLLQAVRSAIQSVEGDDTIKLVVANIPADKFSTTQEREHRKLAKQAERKVSKAIMLIAYEQSQAIAKLFAVSPKATEELVTLLVSAPYEQHCSLIRQSLMSLTTIHVSA